jgi:hypothetical protein
VKAVAWDREKFLRLKAALDDAITQRAHRFPFDPEPPKPFAVARFSSKPVAASYIVFTIPEARQKVAELEVEFAAPDQPAREYREGREGE